jgi:hypothetical protein
MASRRGSAGEDRGKGKCIHQWMCIHEDTERRMKRFRCAKCQSLIEVGRIERKGKRLDEGDGER